MTSHGFRSTASTLLNESGQSAWMPSNASLPMGTPTVFELRTTVAHTGRSECRWRNGGATIYRLGAGRREKAHRLSTAPEQCASDRRRTLVSNRVRKWSLPVCEWRLTNDEPDDGEAYRPEEWLSALDAIRRSGSRPLFTSANFAIAKRAHAGLLRADVLIFQWQKRADDVEIRSQVWWAEGQAALEQDWELGDFVTWIDHTDKVQAFGVRFHMGDLTKMTAGAVSAATNPSAPQEPKATGGRPLSDLWPEWVAELAMYLHENGVPSELASKG